MPSRPWSLAPLDARHVARARAVRRAAFGRAPIVARDSRLNGACRERPRRHGAVADGHEQRLPGPARKLAPNTPPKPNQARLSKACTIGNQNVPLKQGNVARTCSTLAIPRRVPKCRSLPSGWAAEWISCDCIFTSRGSVATGWVSARKQAHASPAMLKIRLGLTRICRPDGNAAEPR